jgi:hypothetical protein
MKYNIENNIDFYKELYTSLDETNDKLENTVNSNENANICLISNQPLKDNYVELKCGHKFNYEPLYKDIFNYKKKFNNMETMKTKLKQNQLRCPYCRNVQDELLPYYEYLGYPKEHGVNFYDINKSIHGYSDFIDPNNQCQYQIVTFDSSGNSHSYQCNHYGYIHISLKNKYNVDTKYCYNHKLAVVKSIKEDLKEKQNALKLEIKNKKLEEQNKKLELKNKLKMESIKNKVKQQCESTSDNSEYCQEILKSGKNKGIICYAKNYKNSLCRRHYNVKIKEDNLAGINNIIESEENIVIG